MSLSPAQKTECFTKWSKSTKEQGGSPAEMITCTTGFTCVPRTYLTDNTTERIYVFLCGRRRGNTIPVTEHRPHTARIRCRRCAGRTRLGCLVWQVTEFSLNHEQVISDRHMMIWWWAFRAVIFRCRKYWQSIKYRCTLILCCYISTREGQNYFRRYRYGVGEVFISL